MALLEGCAPVVSPVAGSIWKLQVEAETAVQAGDTIAIIECMKMEISLKAHCSGIVKQIFCAEGERVAAGQCLASLLPEEV